MDELESFLRSVNSSKPWYIGQPGQGTKEEFGKLFLDEDENFCMGGPGMIMSRETLARIGPHLRSCLRHNLFSTHEDVEVGRCVRKHAGISCTWNYEMTKIFYHNGTYRGSFSGNLDDIRIERAMAFHPLKVPALQYRLRQHFTGLKVKGLRSKVIRLKRSAAEYAEFTTQKAGSRLSAPTDGSRLSEEDEERGGEDDRKYCSPPLTDGSRRRRRRTDAVWKYFDRWSVSSGRTENPRLAPSARLKTAIKDVIDHLLLRLNDGAPLKGRVYDLKHLNFGYYQVLPAAGIDYVFHLVLVCRQHSPKTRTFNEKWVGRVRLPFSEIEYRAEPLPPSKINDGESRRARRRLHVSFIQSLLSFSPFPTSVAAPLEPVNFVLTLAGRFENFKRFMSYWEAACFPAEACGISVILFSTGNSSVDFTEEKEEFFDSIARRHPDALMRRVRGRGAFSRGVGVELGASFYHSDALLFICDVDLVFTSALVDRIRRTALRGRRVYYPIMYSQFNSSLTFPADNAIGSTAAETSINKNNKNDDDDDDDLADRRRARAAKFDPTLLPFSAGWNETVNCFNDPELGDVSGYWRQFSYGMVALYNSDLRLSGGFDLSIQGWGKEDADLYDKIVAAGLDVFRAGDVGLFHVYHQIHCDRQLPTDQLAQCLNTQLQTWLSRTVLARMLLPVKDSFRFRSDVTADIVPL